VEGKGKGESFITAAVFKKRGPLDALSIENTQTSSHQVGSKADKGLNPGRGKGTPRGGKPSRCCGGKEEWHKTQFVVCQKGGRGYIGVASTSDKRERTLGAILTVGLQNQQQKKKGTGVPSACKKGNLVAGAEKKEGGSTGKLP